MNRNINTDLILSQYSSHICVPDVQRHLQHLNLDGWLFYDFRRSNDLACRFLKIPATILISRRFFYWIPRAGDPVKIIHRIENHVLDHLPGSALEYSTWQELEDQLAGILQGCHSIAMEYSPKNAIPTVSKVDAGTVELVRSFGVQVESSADLLQSYISVWSDQQLELHRAAAEVLQTSVEKAWKYIAEALSRHKEITEVDVQQFLLQEFKNNHCICDDSPICAVNAHAADPHCLPGSGPESIIRKNDFVLIDVWCKKDVPGAVYADITRVGVCGQPTKRHQEIFDIVKRARDAAVNLLQERLLAGKELRGWEVDQACRQVIIQAGFGQFFPHRTGHNIGERDHGDGANIDNFETRDVRLLIPGTCFSIEPGIYLPGEFGVRLEDDVYLSKDGKSLQITKGMQSELALIVGSVPEV
ncbi:MAG: M24 family metallopeptidase [Parachlamydiaceae bacterium]